MKVTALLILFSSFAVAGCATPGAIDVPVIALTGDSTVTDEKGWGGAFANALSGRAVVHNFAASGRSAKSYTDEGRLPQALAVTPDYVFIQFGHNGQPGKGAHRETDPEGSYRDYLRQFVADIRAAGAEPVIVSSLARRNFGEDSMVQSTLGPWAEGARAVANELDTSFIDLHARSITHHNRMGPARSALFDMAPGDHTHLNDLGASAVTGLIFDALADINHPLAPLRPMQVRVGDSATAGKDMPRVNTLAEAIALAPSGSGQAFRILLDDGRYVEKLVVDKPNVSLVGASQSATVISYADSGASLGPDGKPVGTWGSYTVKVTAPGFSARELTIENDFDYAANLALADDDPDKIRDSQGVALMLAEGSDRAQFDNVTLTGNQDTLFVDAGRSYFRDVRIIGHVDFIFGAGQAVFERATIEARNRVGKDPVAYITAPSTHVAMPFGFLFLDCRLVRHDADVPEGSVKLGRPWHPGGDPAANGSAVFRDCFMDDHIAEDGYSPISSTVDGVRTWFDLEPGSRFFEHGSHGPGAKVGPRRPQLDDAAVRYYTRENVLGDWKPFAEDW